MAKRGGGRRKRSRPGLDRRWRKRDHIPWLLGIGLIVYVAFNPHYGLWVVTLLNLLLLLFWYLFLMPTKCDFEVDGRGCRLDVYGKVRGCERYHSRDKLDAIYAVLGMRNPGAAFRVTWLDGADGGRPLGAGSGRNRIRSTDQDARRSQALFNTISLIVAIVGSAAGVLALFMDN